MKTLNVLLLAVSCISVSAQTSRPGFANVTIKPNRSGSSNSSIQRGPGSLNITNVPLSDMLCSAYHILQSQLSGGPAWVYSERFDIDANSDSGAIGDELTLMTQSLLEERFQLKLHREMKEFDGYVLTVGPTGSKLESV